MKIKRDLMEKLKNWKKSPDRKPLILRGVRQCGKTFLLHEFGRLCFKNVAYFNFESNEDLSSLFAGSYNPKEILKNLGVIAGFHIEAEKTLVIFDEIQACPRAINSLKYFCEQAPEYAIVSAGSLLGVSLASEAGFPVGKVSFLELTPCTFSEYLESRDKMMAEFCKNAELAEIPEIFLKKLEEYLREYIALGGMPAVLTKYLETNNLFAAEDVLDGIFKSYEMDFSKHAPKEDVKKLYLIWNSIPKHLARENAKFIFDEVRSGARAKDLEDEIEWLLNSGLVKKVYNVKNPQLPLMSHIERKIFKLYTADTGILRRLAKLPIDTVISAKDLFADFKGRLVENYVLQQLSALEISPVCYWTSSADAEVDFLIQSQDGAIPVEVKSGENLKAKSLATFRKKYSPELSIRASMKNLRLDAGLLNIPLPFVNQIKRMINAALKNNHR